jgi:hypothetical protein
VFNRTIAVTKLVGDILLRFFVRRFKRIPALILCGIGSDASTWHLEAEYTLKLLVPVHRSHSVGCALMH